jgi:hypothetical protein
MTPDLVEFQARLLAYFSGEKRESVLFLLAGLCAMAGTLALWRGGGPWRGMIAPLALVGAIQIAVGGAVFLRTDRQVATLSARLAEDARGLRADETARMAAVMRSFRAYKAVEVAVLAVGVLLALIFPYGSALHAAGAGCLLQGGLTLVLDLFAEGRGHDYVAALSRLTPA